MLREIHGRIRTLDNRLASQSEVTKQEKKRQGEADALAHMMIPSRRVSANAPIDPLNITHGRTLPTMQVEHPTCPTHASIVLPSQLN